MSLCPQKSTRRYLGLDRASSPRSPSFCGYSDISPSRPPSRSPGFPFCRNYHCSINHPWEATVYRTRTGKRDLGFFPLRTHQHSQKAASNVSNPAPPAIKNRLGGFPSLSSSSPHPPRDLASGPNLFPRFIPRFTVQRHQLQFRHRVLVLAPQEIQSKKKKRRRRQEKEDKWTPIYSCRPQTPGFHSRFDTTLSIREKDASSAAPPSSIPTT